MKFPLRLITLVLAVIFLSACQPRIQPIYVPSSVALPPGLETAPLSVIRDGILKAGGEKGWIMEEREPGVIRASLGIRGKHESVVDVVYNNQSFDINYVSSRNLLSQGARIHRSYNAWVRQLETSINKHLGYAAAEYKRNPAAATADAPTAVPVVTVFDPTGTWNVSATYTPTIMSASFCPKQRNWNFKLDYSKRGDISETYWSDGVQLNVAGEHSEDYSELDFSVPEGGSKWQLTKPLKLDGPQIRLTSEPTHSTASNCIGVLDIIMRSPNSPTTARAAAVAAPVVALVPETKPASTPAVGQNPASAASVNSTPVVAAASAPPQPILYPTGNWRVTAYYEASPQRQSFCKKSKKWEFDLDIQKGIISHTAWNDRSPIYVFGLLTDEKIEMNFDVPNGGSDWEWTERFKLDKSEKTFTALPETSSSSDCNGTITVNLKKQPAAIARNTATPANSPEAKAQATWLAIKGNNDEQQLRLFLKDHPESKYTEAAVVALNGVLQIKSPNSFPALGKWTISAIYIFKEGNDSYCPSDVQWKFDMLVTPDLQSKTLWKDSYALYVTATPAKGGIQMSFDMPKGGSDWRSKRPMLLTKGKAAFVTKANSISDSWRACSGELKVSMDKRY